MRDAGQAKTGSLGRLAAVWGGLLVFVVTLALTFACGDDGGSSTVSPTPQGTSAASPAASPTSAVAAGPCQVLRDAERYRFVSRAIIESPETTENLPEGEPTPPPSLTRDFQGPFSLEYIVDAAFVSPGSFDVQISGGVTPFRMIVIGSQGWIEFPEGWKATEPPLIPYQAPTVCEAIVPGLDLSQAEATEDEIDELKTLHYSFPKAAAQQSLSKIFGAGSDMDLLIHTLDVDLWLSDDDEELVRLEFQGKGLYGNGRPLMVHVVLDVRDINDDNVKVEAPI